MGLQGLQPKPSTNALDFLYCHEETWVDDLQEERDDNDDDDEQLVDLISKEEREQVSLDLTPLMMVATSIRRDAVEWMIMVNAHHGFSTLTLVLAVNYFDRYLLHKIPNLNAVCVPWVTQLASIACLSLASKFEETHVPLLLDFQIGCTHVFDVKTIRQMELLVLSTLEWKMNPVTPFSYFEHLMRKLKWKAHLQQQILWRTQSLILSFIADPGYMWYTPSAVAAAVVLQAIRELELKSLMESEIQLLDALRISKVLKMFVVQWLHQPRRRRN